MREMRLALGILAALLALWAMGGVRALRIVRDAFLFLLSRRWVVVVATLFAVPFGVFMWMSAHERGHDPSIELVAGISVLCGYGFSSLFVGLGFLGVRARVSPHAPPAEPEGRWRANHVLRRESRGGRLYLTADALHFVPSRFAIQPEPWTLTLSELANASAEGTRLLVLKDARGTEHELILENAKRVADRLTARLEATT